MPRLKNKSKRIAKSFRPTERIWNQLEEVARLQDRTTNDILNELVAKYLREWLTDKYKLN